MGQIRCLECAHALAGHTDVTVRRLLAQEAMLPAVILETLLVDPDFLVAEYAASAFTTAAPVAAPAGNAW